MAEALDQGASLVLFPEGTRNTTDEPLLPFKSGLYRLLSARPGVPCIPVWIGNADRVLPKGACLPVPLFCTVTFGAPTRLRPGEPLASFLPRARRMLLELARPVLATGTSGSAA